MYVLAYILYLLNNIMLVPNPDLVQMTRYKKPLGTGWGVSYNEVYSRDILAGRTRQCVLLK